MANTPIAGAASPAVTGGFEAGADRTTASSGQGSVAQPAAAFPPSPFTSSSLAGVAGVTFGEVGNMGSLAVAFASPAACAGSAGVGSTALGCRGLVAEEAPDSASIAAQKARNSARSSSPLPPPLPPPPPPHTPPSPSMSPGSVSLVAGGVADRTEPPER